MTADIYDPTRCLLGEGPLWHPERGQLYWFDIWNSRLLTREAGATRTWQFDENVSAAGWIDRDTLLVASESRLMRFDLASGAAETVTPLEADIPGTRSNDGRADPWGGFWIGTMDKEEKRVLGAIYRYYRGELRKLHDGIKIPNAIAFAPDRSAAYFTDTVTRKILRQPLGSDGWPAALPEVFVDCSTEGINPDGAVTDAEGNLWCAFWGSAMVRAFSPAGAAIREVAVPGRHSSCPAFGGERLATLYCTSAAKGLTEQQLRDTPENGMTFAAEGIGAGLPEPRVVL